MAAMPVKPQLPQGVLHGIALVFSASDGVERCLPVSLLIAGGLVIQLGHAAAFRQPQALDNFFILRGNTDGTMCEIAIPQQHAQCVRVERNRLWIEVGDGLGEADAVMPIAATVTKAEAAAIGILDHLLGGVNAPAIAID